VRLPNVLFGAIQDAAKQDAKAGYWRNLTVLLEGRAPSRPKALVYTATTERGPPNHLKTCAQKVHKLRRKKYKTTVMRACLGEVEPSGSSLHALKIDLYEGLYSSRYRYSRMVGHVRAAGSFVVGAEASASGIA